MKMRSRGTPSVVACDQVRHASLYERVPLARRLYGAPFAALYGAFAALAGGLVARGAWDDAWLVVLAAIAALHVLLILSCHWSVHVDARVTCRPLRIEALPAAVASGRAPLVLVVPRENGGRPALCGVVGEPAGEALCFFFQRQKYTFSPAADAKGRRAFAKVAYPVDLPLAAYMSPTGRLGLVGEPAAAVVAAASDPVEGVYGANRFEMPIPTFMELFKEHAVAPFFVFQVFCVALWCLDDYWYYSLFTLFMLVVFESTVVGQRLKSLREFRAMSIPAVALFVSRDGRPDFGQAAGDGAVQARRFGRWVEAKSDALLPGDLVLLAMGRDGTGELTVPCDIVLVAGRCIVNEAMITGESTPMLKESLYEMHLADAPASGNALDIERDRTSVLFGGTKVLQMTFGQEAAAADAAAFDVGGARAAIASSCGGSGSKESARTAEDGEHFCIGYVVRTGFETLQGRLVRTMIFTSERVSANNGEAFAFIAFLLLFAIAAAAYILYWTWGDPTKSRSKMLLECALIITAVVPPELPMELSLAVNHSLGELAKRAIFCMEPFRIPFAGKVDVACFDKTGTLTGENLVVQGVVLLPAAREAREAAAPSPPQQRMIASGKDLPLYTAMVIGGCHSLFKIDGQARGKAAAGDAVVGDPMEKASLAFVRCTLATSDRVVQGAGSSASLDILHRYPFSSALKRMSCIVLPSGTAPRAAFVVTKGAPEVVQGMLQSVPAAYEETFGALAHSGARVLALAYKALPAGAATTVASARLVPREAAEGGLTFAGFLTFHCPLKADSKAAIASLRDALHHVVMITGDSALTALHTAYELAMVSRPALLIEGSMVDSPHSLTVSLFDAHKSIERRSGGAPFPSTISLDGDNSSSKSLASLAADRALFDQYDFALNGDAVEMLSQSAAAAGLFERLLLHCAVFARTSPGQKELILARFKGASLVTLMCGDGTNDVGALKQAHVGVALLDGKPEELGAILADMAAVERNRRRLAVEKSRLDMQRRFPPPPAAAGSAAQRKAVEEMQERIALMTADMEESEANPMVRLGDASVAAPFTSKISTIGAVVDIVRQGRCTLVTTMQMYKILALNSLISAYGLSVLHLEGIRYGDFQVTVTGMLLASCFLFLSKGRPVERLAAHRPQGNICNWYVVSSVLGQFALHIACLYVVLTEATRWSFRIRPDEHTKFAPGLVNTAVFLVSLLMQVSTFVVNYQGRPFRESLMENKSLRNALGAVAAIAIVAATEAHMPFNEYLQLVALPPAFKRTLLTAMAVDFGGCLAIEAACHAAFFDALPRITRLRRL